MSQLLFVNIGWMTNYKGPTSSDRPAGGFGYLKGGKAIGHEAWNFEPHGQKVYGYVPRSTKINLARLGASRGASELSGVTVVWIARKTKENRTYIVGWYEDATVYEAIDATVLDRSADMSVAYQIEAPAAKARLLAVDQRQFWVPTSKEKGNLGQSPVWYGKDNAFRERVRNYVAEGGAAASNPGAKDKQKGKGWLLDVELRQRIEREAVTHAHDYFSSTAGGNREVKSVESLARGWDLEATGTDGDVLKIEVKGLLGKELVVDVSHNEYQKMCSHEHRAQYVLYVVSEATEPHRKGHIFRFSGVHRGKVVFATDDGRKLRIRELVAARLSVSP